MDSFRSPVQSKTQKSGRKTAEKEIVQTQKNLINQMISKHLTQKNRMSQPPKPLTSSRNTERTEESMKTFNNGANTTYTLTQVSSLASLHSSNPIAKSKGDTLLKTSVIPSSTFDKRNLTNNQKLDVKSKKSPEGRIPQKGKPQEKKEVMNYQPIARKNNTATSKLKSNRMPMNQTMLQKASKNMPNFNATQSSIDYEFIKLQQTTFPQQKLSKQDKHQKSHQVLSTIQQPLLQQSISSPRNIGGLLSGLSMGTSSTLFSGTESIVSSSQMQYNSMERKMCLSEKIAPKGKKRPNAQKQPKQILITREQINLPQMSIQSSSQQNQMNLTNSPSKNEQSFINQSVGSTFKNNQTNEEIIRLQLNVTPNNHLNEFDEFQEQFDKDERDSQYLLGSIPQSTHKNEKSGTHLFSFHAYNNSQNHMNNGITSNHEESKEITGYFALDGTRPSIEGTVEKRKQFEVATPVFQTSNKSQCSFRPSDVIQSDVIKLTEEDNNKEELKLKDNKNEIRNGNLVDSGFNQATDVNTRMPFTVNNFFSEDNYNQQTMKKVKSSEGIGLKHELKDNVIPFQKLNKNQGNTQSSSNLFGRLKSFIYQIRGDNTQDQQQDLQNKLLYRCACGQSEKPYGCVKALKWLTYSSNNEDFDYEQNKQLYDNLLKTQQPSGSETQIERDISRTFTNADPCMNNQEVQLILSRVLTAFSKYDTSIGYVQGMNFIVGALLMHCTEEIAFWLFVSLIEDYEMRDIFQPKLPGLYKHSQILELLESVHTKKLYTHFGKHNIQVEMYASDWIFALFSNIIPISEYHYFLDQFFEGGWIFFYKFSLSFLKSLTNDLCECDDISEILTIIKLKHVKRDLPSPKNHEQYKSRQDISNSSAGFFSSKDDGRKRQSDSVSSQRSPGRSGGIIQNKLKSMINKVVYGQEYLIDSQSYKDDCVWEQLVQLSIKEWEEEFNDINVQNLLSNFDNDKLIFNSVHSTPRNSSPQPKSSSKKKHNHQRNSSLQQHNSLQQPSLTQQQQFYFSKQPDTVYYQQPMMTSSFQQQPHGYLQFNTYLNDKVINRGSLQPPSLQQRGIINTNIDSRMSYPQKKYQQQNQKQYDQRQTCVVSGGKYQQAPRLYK